VDIIINNNKRAVFRLKELSVPEAGASFNRNGFFFDLAMGFGRRLAMTAVMPVQFVNYQENT
jgi:hypothetical protein